MTPENTVKFSAKHSGIKPSKRIASLVKERITDNTISCAEAYTIAVELKVKPIDVGTTLDLLEIRIEECQLGLFGYGKQKKIIRPADNVNPELRRAIEAALTNGCLTCASAWEIAEQYGLTRLELAAAVEKLKIKIFPCQLGAFRQ